MTETPSTPPRKPMHPLAILAAAIVLPRAGQVFNREPVRGLIFVFFMLLPGGFTLQTASPGVSIVGKRAGGLFVSAVSIFDADRKARIRHELWRYASETA